MSKFSLKSYSKNIDISDNEVPSWVVNGSDKTKELYGIVNAEKDRVLDEIRKNPEISVRESKIQKIILADKANITPSALVKSKQPFLHEYIDEVNKELSDYKEKQHKKHTGATYQPKRSELLEETKVLKNRIKEMQRGKISTIVAELIDRDFTTDVSKLRVMLDECKDRIEEKDKIISNLRKELRKNNIKIFK